MALVFTPSPENPGPQQAIGNLFALVGTLTVSGSYATGGDTFAAGQDLESFMKRVGRGKVLYIDVSRGLSAEWDTTNKKLKLYTAGNTEMAAAGYAAGYTASPLNIFVLGR